MASATKSAVVVELGMRVRGKGVPAEPYFHAEICGLIAKLLDALSKLGPKDREIAEAVCREGNLRAAARLLAPGQRYYRAHIQRKVKVYRELLVTLVQDQELRSLFWNMADSLADAGAAPARRANRSL